MELALVVKDIDTWEEVSRWESLVKGYNNFQYEQAALDVHGISISEAQGNGLELKEFVGTLIKIFKNFTPKGDRGGGKPILAGHNVAFDLSMLKAAFKLAGEDLHKHVLSNNEIITAFDTLPMSKFVWPGKDMSHKLGEVCKRAGLGDFIAHRAMPDVIASCDLMEYFRNRFNMGKAVNGGVGEVKSSNSKQREIINSNHKVKFQF